MILKDAIKSFNSTMIIFAQILQYFSTVSNSLSVSNHLPYPAKWLKISRRQHRKCNNFKTLSFLAYNVLLANGNTII